MFLARIRLFLREAQHPLSTEQHSVSTDTGVLKLCPPVFADQTGLHKAERAALADFGAVPEPKGPGAGFAASQP